VPAHLDQIATSSAHLRVSELEQQLAQAREEQQALRVQLEAELAQVQSALATAEDDVTTAQRDLAEKADQLGGSEWAAWSRASVTFVDGIVPL